MPKKGTGIQGDRLDGLARELASGEISRRGALKRIVAAGLGLGAAATPGLAHALGGGCPGNRVKCGKKCCPENAKCKKGKCKCKRGFTKCGKKCVDTETSLQHCGECENECVGDESCVEGVCAPPSMVPSNITPADGLTCGASATGDLTVTTVALINTDTDCTAVQPQAGGPDLCVVVYQDVFIASGASLSVTGSRPLALLATETITLAGLIDAAAGGTASGPGTSLPATVGQDASGDSRPGSGGGGHAGGGAAGGGADTPGGAGGAAAGSETAVPLIPGGRGGPNGTAAGGGGGGGLQLSACESLTITADARINASGGGGMGGAPGASAFGGAGGGAGGSILVEAPVITLSAGALVIAKGGGGGAGGNSTSGSGTAGAQGADPAFNEQGAPGGPGTPGQGANGGTGASVTLPGQGNPTATSSGAGGGGGALGRIRFNVGTDEPPSTAGTLIVPSPSFGTITTT
ncbi:MAG: hypothetical protein QOI31_1785 [Solirubrobacterales bacterium]|nr:hypothetical protein [Solirubrobacterales bacterium]